MGAGATRAVPPKFEAEAKLETLTKLKQQNIVQQKLVQQKIADLQGDAPQNKRSATKASPKLPELKSAQKRQRSPGMCAPPSPPPLATQPVSGITATMRLIHGTHSVAPSDARSTLVVMIMFNAVSLSTGGADTSAPRSESGK